MTTTTSRAGCGRVGFPEAARMEWIKLRSLRSTWWVLVLTVAGAAGIAVAVGVNTQDAAADLTNNALAGIALGLLLTGVLGVLAMTGEHSSGTIRATLAAVPNRPLVLAAKAAVFGALALAAGEAAAFIAFFAGAAALPADVPAPTLGQPGVLRAVVLGGAGYCLIGLLGVGFGAVVRHSAAAIAVLVGGVYILAQLVAGFATWMMAWLPIAIVANSLSVTRPVGDGQFRFLSPWAGLGVLALYALAALAAGAVLLARRDA
jgi:ABC-2 type transport system permease protein